MHPVVDAVKFFAAADCFGRAPGDEDSEHRASAGLFNSHPDRPTIYYPDQDSPRQRDSSAVGLSGSGFFLWRFFAWSDE